MNDIKRVQLFTAVLGNKNFTGAFKAYSEWDKEAEQHLHRASKAQKTLKQHIIKNIGHWLQKKILERDKGTTTEDIDYVLKALKELSYVMANAILPNKPVDNKETQAWFTKVGLDDNMADKEDIQAGTKEILLHLHLSLSGVGQDQDQVLSMELTLKKAPQNQGKRKGKAPEGDQDDELDDKWISKGPLQLFDDSNQPIYVEALDTDQTQAALAHYLATPVVANCEFDALQKIKEKFGAQNANI
ncbi:unnamed protein product [Rhizoctonia solani]|uniref:Uncharacterized protein n=1 Tax=Rhizoctonia solani TaxID=456999 RepID=A0A8H2WGY0_9AGAM|nr:unnamed protein product [Rhizoctonia solani]